jgi:hypothetical protein
MYAQKALTSQAEAEGPKASRIAGVYAAHFDTFQQKVFLAGSVENKRPRTNSMVACLRPPPSRMRHTRDEQ